jgi:hypothetical protein
MNNFESHRRRLERPLKPLPSLFDLPGGAFEGVLVAVAIHIAGPIHPFGVESWDLTLHAEGFEAVSSDPFSFTGEFLHQGLRRIRVDLLGPAGFVVPSRWPSNDARMEYHTTIEWMPQRQTEFLT